MKTIKTIQEINQAVKEVQNSKLSTIKQNRIIKAVKTPLYSGVSYVVKGYNISMNKAPLQLATYLIKLETSRSKTKEVQKLSFE